MSSVLSYIKDSYNELSTKVTWSTLPDLQSNTVIVLVASVIIALVIFIMDDISNVVLKTLVYGTKQPADTMGMLFVAARIILGSAFLIYALRETITRN